MLIRDDNIISLLRKLKGKWRFCDYTLSKSRYIQEPLRIITTTFTQTHILDRFTIHVL